MAIFASICVGIILGGALRGKLKWRWCLVAALYFGALALTGTRAAIAAFLLGFIATAVIAGGRRVMLSALAVALALGSWLLQPS
jgi:hypothetical protein